jgi:hypothetical protein
VKQKYEERIISIIDRIKCCLIMSPLFSIVFSGAGVVDSHSFCSDDDSSSSRGGGRRSFSSGLPGR